MNNHSLVILNHQQKSPETGQPQQKRKPIRCIRNVLFVAFFVATQCYFLTNDEDGRGIGAATIRSSQKINVTDDNIRHLPELLQDHTKSLPTKTSMVILNIGSNVDPIIPKLDQGPCARSIAFEPIVADRIPSHPQLNVISAAVSNYTSSSTIPMQVYNTDGVSSSIHTVDQKFAKWSQGHKENKDHVEVPLVSLTHVLESIPEHVPIQLVMTDIQGHDFTAVSSAISTLRKRQVPYLRTEVSLDGSFSYVGAQNDLCRDWIPFMTSHGYIFDGLYPPRSRKMGWENATEILKRCEEQRATSTQPWAGLKELDALWRAAGVFPTSDYIQPYLYPLHNPRTRQGLGVEDPRFQKEDYDACK